MKPTTCYSVCEGIVTVFAWYEKDVSMSTIDPGRMVVRAFPTIEEAQAWGNSDAAKRALDARIAEPRDRIRPIEELAAAGNQDAITKVVGG